MFLQAAAAVKDNKSSWPFLAEGKLLHDRSSTEQMSLLGMPLWHRL